MRRVLIIGGGIAGMASGIALARRGMQTEIVEINGGSHVPQAGLVLDSAAMQALEALQVSEPAARAGFILGNAQRHDATGPLLSRSPGVSTSSATRTALGISWLALQEVLSGALRQLRVPLRTGVTFTAIVQERNAVRVAFTDGSAARYDLVVGADGAYSKVRTLLFGDAGEPLFTGKGTWRCLLPRPGDVDAPCYYDGAPGCMAGIVPLSPAALQLFAVCDEPGNPRFPRASLAVEFRQRLAGYGGAIARIREQIDATSTVIYRPQETLQVAAPWHRGSVLLIGDAAHVIAPRRDHVLGQGATLALEDAVVLGEELAQSVPLQRALAVFMERRREAYSPQSS